MMQKIYNFFKEKREKGQSIVEYGILIAAVVAAIIAAKSSLNVQEKVEALGTQINANLQKGVDETTPSSSGGGGEG